MKNDWCSSSEKNMPLLPWKSIWKFENQLQWSKNSSKWQKSRFELELGQEIIQKAVTKIAPLWGIEQNANCGSRLTRRWSVPPEEGISPFRGYFNFERFFFDEESMYNTSIIEPLEIGIIIPFKICVRKYVWNKIQFLIWYAI